jgi:hypothetical protein
VIAKAFTRAGFAVKQVSAHSLIHDDLPWQCPPLQTALSLDGLDLQGYCSYTETVDVEALYRAWTLGLYDLFHAPLRACNEYGWRGMAKAMPNSNVGDRLLHLSVPEGWPKPVEYAGAMFSIEMANLLVSGAKLEIHQGFGDFYVETPHGAVGVKSGVPAAPSHWDIPVSHMVEALLTSPRGRITQECRYDLLALMRSVLYEESLLFNDFEAVDAALQTYYFLEGDRRSGVLLEEMSGKHPAATLRAVHLLEEAIETLAVWTLNDQIKLQAIQEILVPDIFTPTEFYRKIFDTSRRQPAVLTDKALKKLKSSLLAERKLAIAGLPLEARGQFKEIEE